MTKKQIKKLLPKGAKYISLGIDTVAFCLNNKIISKTYKELK
mgnify:CR=1 FL=1